MRLKGYFPAKRLVAGLCAAGSIMLVFGMVLTLDAQRLLAATLAYTDAEIDQKVLTYQQTWVQARYWMAPYIAWSGLLTLVVGAVLGLTWTLIGKFHRDRLSSCADSKAGSEH